jgi:hypothetical protein
LLLETTETKNLKRRITQEHASEPATTAWAGVYPHFRGYSAETTPVSCQATRNGHGGENPRNVAKLNVFFEFWENFNFFLLNIICSFRCFQISVTFFISIFFFEKSP